MAQGYARSQIILHWSVVVLVALQFLFADGMSEAFEGLERSGAVEPTVMSNLHIAGGALIFVLMLVRLALRLSHGVPPQPEAGPGWMHTAAHAGHLALYALLVLLPLTGAIAWYRASETAGDIHEVLKAILLVLIAVHILAALYHQFVLRTNLLARMTRPVD